jgi:phosphonate degradation associated HDIG domain protein
MSARADAAIRAIVAAFEAHGGDTYGETVSQREHALQCAALAAEDGAGEALIAAALLHDFGHLSEGLGDLAEQAGRDARHEPEGARRLAAWFGPAVTRPVALHVAAKRYLCAVEPDYLGGLSAASILSLSLQGGPFDAEQARRFERAPSAVDAVRLRRWDDLGKVEGLATPSLESWLAMLARLVDAA